MEAVHCVEPIVWASEDGTCASIGALVVGFRYRRSAGVGVSSNRGGMRSSVNGTRGSMEMIDRVRKSSGSIVGVVRFESDLAAERNAFSEAVRFDLKADLRRGDSSSTTEGVNNTSSFLSWGRWNTRKSSSSKSISGEERGSSEGEATECILRASKGLRFRGLGVITELYEGEASLRESPSSEGIDSLDMVLVDITDSWPFSLSFTSSSRSSGGLSRKSRGLFSNDKLISLSSDPCLSIASTVNR